MACHLTTSVSEACSLLPGSKMIAFQGQSEQPVAQPFTPWDRQRYTARRESYFSSTPSSQFPPSRSRGEAAHNTHTRGQDHSKALKGLLDRACTMFVDKRLYMLRASTRPVSGVGTTHYPQYPWCTRCYSVFLVILDSCESKLF